MPGESFEFDFSMAAEALVKRGLIKQVGSDLDLSNVSCYWYDDTIDFMADMFNKNQMLFLKSGYICY